MSVSSIATTAKAPRKPPGRVATSLRSFKLLSPPSRPIASKATALSFVSPLPLAIPPTSSRSEPNRQSPISSTAASFTSRLSARSIDSTSSEASNPGLGRSAKARRIPGSIGLWRKAMRRSASSPSTTKVLSKLPLAAGSKSFDESNPRRSEDKFLASDWPIREASPRRRPEKSISPRRKAGSQVGRR